MALPVDNVSMAVFCDFENVALGVRDAKYEKFDIKPVLERLLLKGSIVVKKAYCDWDRYKGFKAAMHEASFELIEIPHVRQSGKNSADIRLVVDTLDLCYTKSHVDTFVIISGDSDFSPLVSKLRENAKKVIGVGVKKSTSDLLVANCDEFIFYDDLVREQQRAIAKRLARSDNGAAKRPSDDAARKEARKAEAIALAVETFDALASERDDVGKIWASVLKSAIKRRKPDFNESYYGFRAFGNLLDEAQARGLLEVGRDDKSGAFVSRARQAAAVEPVVHREAPATADDAGGAPPAAPERHGHRKARHADGRAPEPVVASAAIEAEMAATEVAAVPEAEPVERIDAAADSQDGKTDARKRARKSAAKKTGTKKVGAKKANMKDAGSQRGEGTEAGQHAEPKHAESKHDEAAMTNVGQEAPAAAELPAADAPAAPKKPARKAAPRARRPRKAASADA